LAAEKDVVTAAACERIIAFVAFEAVVSGPTEEPIVGSVAVDDIIAPRAEEAIAPCGTRDGPDDFDSEGGFEA
jgi:hypothetical protein